MSFDSKVFAGGSTVQIPMKSSITAEPVARYVVEKIVQDTQLERRLRLETLTLSNGGMISGSDAGQFLAIMVQSVGAKNAIEIGTFTGYTALKIALALPADGRLVCCDINTEWTNIGKKYWREANVDNKIDLKIAPALETLALLKRERGVESFDFAFIDADKMGYEKYYEACLELIRSGGVIVLDNMLWDGAVADASDTDRMTVAIRNLNAKISVDSRVHSCLLTVGDGLMLAYKK